MLLFLYKKDSGHRLIHGALWHESPIPSGFFCDTLASISLTRSPPHAIRMCFTIIGGLWLALNIVNVSSKKIAPFRLRSTPTSSSGVISRRDTTRAEWYWSSLPTVSPPVFRFHEPSRRVPVDVQGFGESRVLPVPCRLSQEVQFKEISAYNSQLKSPLEHAVSYVGVLSPGVRNIGYVEKSN